MLCRGGSLRPCVVGAAPWGQTLGSGKGRKSRSAARVLLSLRWVPELSVSSKLYRSLSRRMDPSRVCRRVCLVPPRPSQRVCFACSLGGCLCRLCSASDALHGGGQTDAEGVGPDASTDGHDQRSARREQLAQKVCGLAHRPPLYLCTVFEASWCMGCTCLGTCKWARCNGTHAMRRGAVAHMQPFNTKQYVERHTCNPSSASPSNPATQTGVECSGQPGWRP